MTNPNNKNRRRRGAVLVIVLVVVALLALAAYTFADLMVTHQAAAQLHGRQLQARALAESGSDAVRLYLMQDEATREEAGGHYNNPTFFQAVPVLMDADARLRSNFTVVVPLIDDEGALGGVRYGLEDESTRLNVNALLMTDQVSENAGRNLLMGLPGMTEDIADAILDWIDEDDEMREYGAESDYYLGLDPPYSAKNAPLDTVEELLLIRGISPQMLFGIDTNRNGMVDPHEMNAAGMLGTQSGMGSAGFSGTTASNSTTASGGSTTATDSLMAEGSMDRGWVGYLTLYSMESNLNSEGLPRIYLNMEDLESLYDQLAERLNEEWARFIVTYRQSGPHEGSEDGEPASALPDLDFTKESKTTLTQVLDLVGAKIQVQIEGEEQPLVVSSPFSDSILEMGVYMSLLMDNCTINASTTIPGRININQAPRTLLMGIPGLEEDVVEEIISQRYQETTEDQVDTHNHETWLLTEGIITLDEMKTLSPFVTAGGDVFRAQIVGYFEDGGAASRVEAVFDATSPRPRILSWKDISHLGRGYPLELLGVQLISNF